MGMTPIARAKSNVALSVTVPQVAIHIPIGARVKMPSTSALSRKASEIVLRAISRSTPMEMNSPNQCKNPDILPLYGLALLRKPG
jgi:hypothetical protein